MTKKPVLKIQLDTMPPWFNFGGHIIFKTLQRLFDVQFSDNPDVFFFSIYGEEHLKCDCTKVFFTHEAAYPDFRYCDYALTFHPGVDTPRHLVFPNYIHRFGYELLRTLETIHQDIPDEVLRDKPQFCAFLVSNGNAIIRNELFKTINAYKTVSSGGKFQNNVGGIVTGDKTFEFIEKSKFFLASENSLAPGYVTEKIVQGFLGRTVPIYWGDAYVHTLFNKDRFIEAEAYETRDEFLAAIHEIDNDDERYLHILRQPVYAGDGALPDVLKQQTLERFLHDIVENRCKDAPRPEFSDQEIGWLKGSHRRHIRAPMSVEEETAFLEARLYYAERKLIDMNPVKIRAQLKQTA